MNKLAILRSKTNILEMHQLCWEVFRPFAYNPFPINPPNVAKNIASIAINAMTNEKRFKVRSLIGRIRDIPDIFFGEM
jgi:hypothetical protein